MSPRAAAGLLAALFVLLLLVGSAPAAEKSEGQKVTDQIICPCSCGEVLTGCTCETGKEMKAFVDNSLKGGRTKDQVVQSLVAQYGEVVLGAPKAKGFNLIVWVAPFLATLVGFAIAFFVLRRWVARKQALAPAGMPLDPSGARSEGDLDALRARAEEEIRRLRG
jgi:cytochrome c-type biogenesis protein CcmH